MALRAACVVSRSTARALLAPAAPRTLGPFGPRVAAPVDFRCGVEAFEVSPQGEAAWLGAPVPGHLLQSCLRRNVAYRLEATVPLAGQVASAAACPLQVTPLFDEAGDATPFLKVGEPNDEDGAVRGPVLWVDGLKMHVSRGAGDTRRFSRLLARCCGALGHGERAGFSGGEVLDLFHGLGITSDEALRLGAVRVATFELPAHAAVRRLAGLLPRPAVVAAGARDPRVSYRLCDVAEPAELFGPLEVACYAPEWPPWEPGGGGRPRRRLPPDAARTRRRRPGEEARLCRSWARHFVPAFLAGGRFQALPTAHEHIARFRRARAG